MLDALQRERYLSDVQLLPGCSVASVLQPVRSVFLYGATRVLESQRQLTEWQLSQARLAERQMLGWFELYRVGLEAGLRFTESATSSLVGARAAANHGASVP